MQLIFWNTAKFRFLACFLQWALENRLDFFRMHTFTTSNLASVEVGAPQTFYV